SPPRREAGKRIAPTLAARTEGGGGLGTDFDTGGGLSSAVAHTVKADNKGHRHDPSADTFVPEIAWTLQERDAKGADSNTKDGHLIVEPVAHSLRADGFDASEDGSGRGTPLIPVPIAFDCKAGANTGFAVGDVPGALRGEGHGGGHAAIAFSCKDHGADARTESAPTLR